MIFYVKELLDAIKPPLYIARGRRPWSLGYYTAKKNAEFFDIHKDKSLGTGFAAAARGVACI